MYIMASLPPKSSWQLARFTFNHRPLALHLTRRRFASVEHGQEAKVLPLSGIRVLDMTRVLAGVSEHFL